MKIFDFCKNFEVVNFFLVDFLVFFKTHFSILPVFKMRQKVLWFVLNQNFVIFGLFRCRSYQLHVFVIFGLLWPKLNQFEISKFRVFSLGGGSGHKKIHKIARSGARMSKFLQHVTQT